MGTPSLCSTWQMCWACSPMLCTPHSSFQGRLARGTACGKPYYGMRSVSCLHCARHVSVFGQSWQEASHAESINVECGQSSPHFGHVIVACACILGAARKAMVGQLQINAKLPLTDDGLPVCAPLSVASACACKQCRKHAQRSGLSLVPIVDSS